MVILVVSLLSIVVHHCLCQVSQSVSRMIYILSLTVAGTPTNLTATRLNTGLAHVRLSWSSVSGVGGYEVFYQLNGSSTVVSGGTTNGTMLDITSGLSPGETYEFFVVSYGSEGSPVLPSNHSLTTTLTFSK